MKILTMSHGYQEYFSHLFNDYYTPIKTTLGNFFTKEEIPFYVQAQEEWGFVEFQAWQSSFNNHVKEIQQDIVLQKINGVELAERLLANQRMDEISERILSPVFYSWKLWQCKNKLEIKAEKIKERDLDYYQHLLFSINVIQKSLEELQISLSQKPELAERYFYDDLINGIILYSGKKISAMNLQGIVNYYAPIINKDLVQTIKRITDVLQENHPQTKQDEVEEIFSFPANPLIKEMIKDMNDVFAKHYFQQEENITLEKQNNNENLFECGGLLLKTVKESLTSTWEYTKENPKTILSITASAALGYVYYSANKESSYTVRIAEFSQWITPTWSNTIFPVFLSAATWSVRTRELGIGQTSLPIISFPSLMLTLFSLQQVKAQPCPQWLGSYNTPGIALGVAVSGSIAYVADGFSGLQIIDVSNPVLPTLLGSYNTPDYADGVAVSGGIAYVVDGASGLQIINVSNPVIPTFLGSYNTPDYAQGVAISSSIAYVADYDVGGLQIINVSNPVAPTLLGSYNTPDYSWGVAVSGSIAYVADGSQGLQIINVSNPVAPTFLGAYSTPDIAQGVAVSGGIAYVADGSSGLQIINVSNPVATTLLRSYNTPDYAYGVAVSSSIAYVADGSSGLQIINVSNPVSPTFLGSYNTPGNAHGIAVSGSIAYVADGASGLQIIDVSCFVSSSRSSTSITTSNTPLSTSSSNPITFSTTATIVSSGSSNTQTSSATISNTLRSTFSTNPSVSSGTISIVSSSASFFQTSKFQSSISARNNLVLWLAITIPALCLSSALCVLLGYLKLHQAKDKNKFEMTEETNYKPMPVFSDDEREISSSQKSESNYSKLSNVSSSDLTIRTVKKEYNKVSDIVRNAAIPSEQLSESSGIEGSPRTSVKNEYTFMPTPSI